MASKGLELIVGARSDPDWGPVLIVGSGGVLAEAMRDIRVLQPDASPEEIVSQFHQLRAAFAYADFAVRRRSMSEAVAHADATLGHFIRSRRNRRNRHQSADRLRAGQGRGCA